MTTVEKTKACTHTESSNRTIIEHTNKYDHRTKIKKKLEKQSASKNSITMTTMFSHFKNLFLRVTSSILKEKILRKFLNSKIRFLAQLCFSHKTALPSCNYFHVLPASFFEANREPLFARTLSSVNLQV